jgi:hypothetical protein
VKEKPVLSMPPERWGKIAQFFIPSDMQTVTLRAQLTNFRLFREKKKERGDNLGVYIALEPSHDELIRRMLQAAEDRDVSFFKTLIKAIKPSEGKVGWNFTQIVCLQFEEFYMRNGFEPTKQQLRDLAKKGGAKMDKRTFTRILSKTGLANLKEGVPGPPVKH